LYTEQTSYGMEYPFGQFGSAVLVVSPPKILPTPSHCGGEMSERALVLCKHYSALLWILHQLHCPSLTWSSTSVSFLYNNGIIQTTNCRERKYNERLTGQDKDREMSLTNYHHGQNRLLSLLPPQGEDSSHSSPPPAWGPSHRRQSSMNFSNMCSSHRLQLFTNCSSLGPSHRVTSPSRKPAPAWAPLHVTTGPARSLLQQGLPMRSQPPSGTSTCSG
ncbi:unnamed protein product, partial [Bubo scandiacus]